MPIRRCPFQNCTFATEDVSDALAAEYFAIHRTEHAVTAVAPAPLKQKLPKIDRPRIDAGSSEEVVSENIFFCLQAENNYQVTACKKTSEASLRAERVKTAG